MCGWMDGWMGGLNLKEKKRIKENEKINFQNCVPQVIKLLLKMRDR